MKKFRHIITGIFIGTIVSAGFITVNVFTAYGVDDPGEVSWWDKTVAGSPDWKFEDLFAINPGKDMYKAVHGKILSSPYDKALDAMASKYGVTKTEAKAMAEGSMFAASSYATNSATTYQDQTQITKMFADDFANFQNLFQMQEDVEMDVGMRELFANNDIKDSGFDLIADLSLIEYILFNDFTEPTIGAPFPGAPASPVPDSGAGGAGASEAGEIVGDGSGSVNDSGESNIKSNQQGNMSVQNNKANIGMGNGNSMQAEILPEDNCSTGSGNGLSVLADAISKFDDLDPTKSDSIDDDDDDSTAGDDDDETEIMGGSGGDSQIPDVPADSWGSTFCPPLNGGGSPEDPFDASTLPSFGGTPGAAAAYESAGFSVSASICFSLELITGKVSASKDLNSVQGEVDKINQTFDEFLNKSLVPNKTTGNMLEAAKCSKSLSALMPEIKFITYSAPVLTPPNDDMIFESNIFSKFNSMLEGAGWMPVNEKFEEQFNVHYPAPDLDQQQFIQNVRDYMAMATGQGEILSRGDEISQNIHAKMVIADTLLPEMEMMASYFEGFKTLYDNIYYGPCTSGTGGNTPLMGKEKE